MKHAAAMLVLVVVAAAGERAHALCEDPVWTSNFSMVAGAASAPSNNTQFTTGTPLSIIAQGTMLYAVRNADGAGGGLLWQAGPFAATIQNFPAPVPTKTGEEAVFVTAQDGNLYKFFAQSTNLNGGTLDWSINLRRSTCSTDQILATPAIQLWQFSNTTFQNAPAVANDDLVFVITRYQCNTFTANRIYAIRAADHSTAWVVNLSGSSWQMDYGSQGCSVDYDRNTIYCGTHLQSGRFQNTLWAVSTLDGTVRWAINAGSIHNIPVLANGRLYVATMDGHIAAYDPATGQQVWAPVAVSSPTAGFARNLWVEHRSSYAKQIVLVDGAGNLYDYVDKDTFAQRVWGPLNFGSQVTSMAAIDSDFGKAFVGLANGRLHQLDLVTGQDEANVIIGNGTVFDASLDAVGGAASPNRISVAGASSVGQSLRRFTVPLPYACCPSCGAPQCCTSDANCSRLNTPCTIGRCNTNGCGVCFIQTLGNGTACTPINSCYVNSVCQAGACIGNNVTFCPCNATGDVACATGQSCCNAIGGQLTSCVNLNAGRQVLSTAQVSGTHWADCGNCGVECPTSKSCVGGVCARLAGSFCGDSPSGPGNPTLAATLNAQAGSLGGADTITFHPGNCEAIMPTWTAATNNGLLVEQAFGGAPMSLPYNSGASNALQGADIAFGIWADDILASMTIGTSPQLVAFSGDRKPNLLGAPFLDTDLSGLPSVFAQPVPLGGVQTSGGALPYADSRFNNGPVGPGITIESPNHMGQFHVLLANVNANGDLYDAERDCPEASWNRYVPAGGSSACLVCGTTSNVCTTSWSNTFVDGGAPTDSVTHLEVILEGESQSGSPITVTMNGVTLGTITPPGSAGCGGCQHLPRLVYDFPGGIPSYVNGGTNTLGLSSAGTFCVVAATVHVEAANAPVSTTVGFSGSGFCGSTICGSLPYTSVSVGNSTVTFTESNIPPGAIVVGLQIQLLGINMNGFGSQNPPLWVWVNGIPLGTTSASLNLFPSCTASCSGVWPAVNARNPNGINYHYGSNTITLNTNGVPPTNPYPIARAIIKPIVGCRWHLRQVQQCDNMGNNCSPYTVPDRVASLSTSTYFTSAGPEIAIGHGNKVEVLPLGFGYPAVSSMNAASAYMPFVRTLPSALCPFCGTYDLSTWIPDTSVGEAASVRVLHVATDRLYDDVYVEVKDANGNDEVLVIRHDDGSIRNIYDVWKTDLKSNGLPPVTGWPSCCTSTCAGTASCAQPFYPNEGRLSALSEVHVGRIVPVFQGTPSFYDLPTLP